MGDSLNNDGKTGPSPLRTMPALFEPGGPGGPGRPKGSRSRLARVLDEAATADAAEVYGVVKSLALGGDLQACKEILSRAWPIPKGRAIEVDLGDIPGAPALPAIIAKILAAVAAGDLAPAEGQELAAVADTYRKSIELADIEARLAKLEKGRIR